VSKPVEMVVVPGSEGDFGVLIGHAPLISTLRDGVIEIHDEGRVSDRIFVAGGFAEVTGERCTVLAEEAVPVGELDRAALEDDLKTLREDLAAAPDDAMRVGFARRIEVIEAKLAAV
jgi:F-type H+-transporting ATPase subunit epsilon